VGLGRDERRVITTKATGGYSILKRVAWTGGRLGILRSEELSVGAVPLNSSPEISPKRVDTTMPDIREHDIFLYRQKINRFYTKKQDYDHYKQGKVELRDVLVLIE